MQFVIAYTDSQVPMLSSYYHKLQRLLTMVGKYTGIIWRYKGTSYKDRAMQYTLAVPNVSGFRILEDHINDSDDSCPSIITFQLPSNDENVIEDMFLNYWTKIDKYLGLLYESFGMFNTSMVEVLKSNKENNRIVLHKYRKYLRVDRYTEAEETQHFFIDTIKKVLRKIENFSCLKIAQKVPIIIKQSTQTTIR
ncbi:hypothetical protein AGLY_001743 [Aphis glycines]|uniref:Uncharacterized protein n=1 Tax=Aphis glycines TaxID=307491 RepID=A0A6G0U4P9_APHGL|nr:hypothetical protein AGLY_001743 [Aphis glycines]